MFIEMFGTIDDIRENPLTKREYDGMWAFEFEDITLIDVPNNRVPYEYDNIRDAEKNFGSLLRKEKI